MSVPYANGGSTAAVPAPQDGFLRVHDWLPGVQEALGPGTRVVVWVQGCSLHCPGCMVPETWNSAPRQYIDPAVLAREVLLREEIRGITLSGGEPTEQAGPVAQLLATVKAGGKDTWVYSGYTIEELIAKDDPMIDRLLASTDVLVDGRYETAKAGSFRFRGSENQRVIRLTNAISIAACRGPESSRINIALDNYGKLEFVGIPPPDFLVNFRNALAARGIMVSNKLPWK